MPRSVPQHVFQCKLIISLPLHLTGIGYCIEWSLQHAARADFAGAISPRFCILVSSFAYVCQCSPMRESQPLKQLRHPIRGLRTVSARVCYGAGVLFQGQGRDALPGMNGTAVGRDGPLFMLNLYMRCTYLWLAIGGNCQTRHSWATWGHVCVWPDA